MSASPGRVVIIGAGPTGLGAAFRLEELGYTDYLLLEGADSPGGLASSVVDAAGFTWDIGGHVQFSHYAYYSEVVQRAVPHGWLTHERESWIWVRGHFVPYPFQYNLHRLDPEDCARALEGLEAAERSRASLPPPEHFGDWITQTFGEEIARLFLRPYNLKTWGHPLDQIGIGWMGERVAVPDLARIRANVAARRDEVSWGPNRSFGFPVEGGTGAIWRGVSALLPAERQRFGVAVHSIDEARGEIVTSTGERVPYDTVVSTMPLDRLCERVTTLSDTSRERARSLRYSSVHVVGVGLEGPQPETLLRKCWMYLPGPESPYYRVTVFSNYSPRNVPPGDCWSLMAEVCESDARPVDARTIVADVVDAMRRDQLIAQGTRAISLWHRREEHGYPTPFVGRDEILEPLRRELESRRIYSRGRFGAWKYEVSNQDHSFMQGVEVAERLVLGIPEVTINRPDEVNSGAFLKHEGPRPTTPGF